MMGQLPKDAASMQQASHQEVVKKQYASPRLVEYGSLAKLTQAGSGGAGDGGATPGSTRMCL